MSKLRVNEVENLANDGSLNFMGNYDVILPLGVYSSGSFTIPSGRTWADYDSIAVLHSRNAGAATCGPTTIATREFLALNPTSFSIVNQSESGALSSVNATSATAFTVTVSGDDVIRQIIGYRKNGVA